MTLIVSWIGIDTHGTSSIYIASDSRITWDNSSKFDLGRKVFAFSKWPDILGYCGDVLFPSIVLNQIVELADSGLLFNHTDSCEQKFEAIMKKMNDLFNAYPSMQVGLEKRSLSVIHASRDPNNNKKFFCRRIYWSQIHRRWLGDEIQLPKISEVLVVAGNGKKEFEENYTRYNSGVNSDTSRNVFHCFCDTLNHIKNLTVGGAPQIVGIYRKPDSSAINIGVIYKKSRFFLGAKIDNLQSFDNVVWRNENFERCDGQTMKKKDKAQSQPDPLRRL